MDGADERGGTAGADERAGKEAGCAVENVPGMISPFEEPCVYALGHLVNLGTGRFSTPVGKVKRPELTDEDMDLATPLPKEGALCTTLGLLAGIGGAPRMPGFDGMRGGPPDFGRLGMGGAPPLAGREGMGGAAPRLLGTGGALAPGREGMAALLWRGGIRGAPGRAGAVQGGTRPSPPGALLGVAMRRGRLGTRRGIAGAPPGMGGGADILLPRTSFSRF